MTKDALLALLDDPEVRAKLLEHVDPARLKADVVEAMREDARVVEPAPEPVFHGPAWLAGKATGPHPRTRLAGPKA